MYLKNIVGHFMVITRHRWVVFKLCCKVGNHGGDWFMIYQNIHLQNFGKE